MNVFTNKGIKFEYSYMAKFPELNYLKVKQFIEENYDGLCFKIINKEEDENYLISDFSKIIIPILKNDNFNLKLKNLTVSINSVLYYDKIYVEDNYTELIYKDLLYYISKDFNLCIYKSDNINFKVTGKKGKL